MAGKRRRHRRHRRPSPGEVRAVARLWEKATCADATPARTYLSRCGCWPGRHVSDAPPLPADSVRWLAREAAPERDEAARWHGLPPGVAGAVVFAWRRPRGPWLKRGAFHFRVAGPLVAVSLVALDARGFPVREAPRSALGNFDDAMFRAGDRADGDAVVVHVFPNGELNSAWTETPWLDALGVPR